MYAHLIRSHYCRVAEGVVKLNDLTSNILSGKLQPTDKVECVITKTFKTVCMYVYVLHKYVKCDYIYIWYVHVYAFIKQNEKFDNLMAHNL